MSRKEEILREAERLKKIEDERHAQAARDERPSRPPLVDPLGMPFGCWLWVVGGCWLAYYLLKKYFE
jgi:hypothetical protein